MMARATAGIVSAAHTPGPWWVVSGGVRNAAGLVAHFNSVQRYEGQDDRYATEFAQREADKLLIAAAPDLLAALESFLRAPSVGSAGPGSSTIAVQDFNLRAARAAIAKATGSAP